jgi:predicted nucleic-acid-binding Zn-ribbon protein
MDIYEKLFKKEITIEDFAILTAQEPQDVIERLQEIIDGYDVDFVPSSALKDVAKTLYQEFKDVSTSDKENKYDAEVKLADTFRKTVTTYDSIMASKSILQPDMYIQNKPQDDVLAKLVPYLCPKCRAKVLEELDKEIIG